MIRGLKLVPAQFQSGGGNGEGLVNRQDLADYPTLQALSGGQSIWYDLNLDGLTDMADLGIIQIA